MVLVAVDGDCYLDWFHDPIVQYVNFVHFLMIN